MGATRHLNGFEFFDFCLFSRILENDRVIVECRCTVCLKHFTYEVGRGRRRRTCSPACLAVRKLAQGRDYRREGRYQVKPRAKTIRKVCAVCSEPFMAAERRRQACGLICGNILGKINGDVGRRRNAEKRRKRVCEHCVKPFTMRNPSGAARAGRTREGRFCSRVCRAAAGRRPVCEEAS